MGRLTGAERYGFPYFATLDFLALSRYDNTMMNEETTMNNETNVPNSLDELLAMQTGNVKEEINREDIGALSSYVRNEIFPEANPTMAQVLVLAKALLEDLETYHWERLEDGDLSEIQRKIWKRDGKNITKALMAIRQVAEG
jgi:hypothetical protein